MRLAPAKTIPGGEETPGSSTAVGDPKPVRESCPKPASIARGSRRSTTVRSSDRVFWRACVRGRCADSLDFSWEDRSGEGPSPHLGSTVGKAFSSVKESVGGETRLHHFAGNADVGGVAARAYDTALTALAKIARPAPEASPSRRPFQEGCWVASRKRSGWGMSPKTRPVGSQTPATSPAEPLGFVA